MNRAKLKYAFNQLANSNKHQLYIMMKLLLMVSLIGILGSMMIQKHQQSILDKS